MRLATWNVNSIRSRADRVAAFLQRQDIDVLALQETKCRDDQFPQMVFDAIGYESAHVGFSQWNGVAILSRVGIEEIEIGFPGQPCWAEDTETEARALGATCGGVRVWSLYVPNGRTLADPHYRYKLDWLAALRDTAAGWLADDPAAQIALTGDWNIAPENADVVRPYAPGPGVYTYWDYTQLRFPRREGMRIDFILGSPALAARTTNALVDREERKGKGASDHAPVIVDLAD